MNQLFFQNHKLRYNIIEDESDIAYIEELTGRIFLNATPTKDKYTLRLLATDGKSVRFTVPYLGRFWPGSSGFFRELGQNLN